MADRDRPDIALLIIDMVNALDFDGGEALQPAALEAATHIAALKRRATDAGVPVIYANDNYGQWRSDFHRVVALCGGSGSRGAPLVEQVRPEATDYFVLKPSNSAFHQTPLERLLDELGVRRLILTGIATDSCVVATAMDANVRDLKLFVPRDCVAAESTERNDAALGVMRASLGADTRIGARITADDFRGTQ